MKGVAGFALLAILILVFLFGFSRQSVSALLQHACQLTTWSDSCHFVSNSSASVSNSTSPSTSTSTSL
ncbi:MAG: hypothetical protein WBE79_03090 [Candidatus Cybelea sp.]